MWLGKILLEAVTRLGAASPQTACGQREQHTNASCSEGGPDDPPPCLAARRVHESVHPGAEQDDCTQERPGWLGEGWRQMGLVAAQEREKRLQHTRPVLLWAAF